MHPIKKNAIVAVFVSKGFLPKFPLHCTLPL